MMFYIDLAIALTKALQSNQIAGVDLDVREEEPPEEDDPVFTLPNISTVTEETHHAMRDLWCRV